MFSLKATVKKLFFKNSSNSYAVFSSRPLDNDFDWTDDKIVLTGQIASLKVGSSYDFKGQLTDHPKYGPQFKVEDFQEVIPDDEDALSEYLSSDKFPGIGKKTAEKLVERFGTKLFDLIADDPKVLNDSGLSKKQISTLSEVIVGDKNRVKAVSQAASFGFNTSMSDSLFDLYGLDFIKMVKDNPYRFIGSIDSYSYPIACQAASLIGFQNLDLQIKGAIKSVLITSEQNEGNTFLTEKQLITRTGLLLDGEADFFSEDIKKSISDMSAKKQVQVQDDRISLKKSFLAEESVANDLFRLSHSAKEKVSFDSRAIEGSGLDANQQQAVVSVFKNKITVLTGGPGTGKTTVISTVIDQWKKSRIRLKDDDDFELDLKKIFLAAPTGRAATRITEVTGHSALTIHRMLGANSDGLFEHDQDDPLDCGLVVIDEMSMVDIELFQHLLKALPDQCHLLLVGDRDQLASVGAGQVLTDLINSDLFPVIELNINHRQTKGSGIDLLSKNLKQGLVDPKMFQPGKDVSFFPLRESQTNIVISKVLGAALRIGIKKEDLQIISPTNRMVDLLNRAARPFLIENDQMADSPVFPDHFLIGDRVMQQENNQEKGVNNGDIGYVTAFYEGKYESDLVVEVDFSGMLVSYKGKESNQLRLSYASTVHKAQGSEFKNVIFVLTSTLNNFVTRNLLYTGVTRAEKSLILIGNEEAFRQVINNPAPPRQTNLIFMLTGDQNKNFSKEKYSSKKASALGKKNKTVNNVLTKSLIDNLTIDPMIGMEGIKPSDFSK